MRTPTPSPFPPYLRDLEESFISSLGWTLHHAADRAEDAPYISDGLGLNPVDLAYPDLRDIFRAVRDQYLDSDAFSWQAARLKLWEAGWFAEDRLRHVVFTDIVCNQLTTKGALPSLRRMVEEEAGKRRGEKPARGGYQ